MNYKLLSNQQNSSLSDTEKEYHQIWFYKIASHSAMNQATWFCFGGRGAVRYFLPQYRKNVLSGEQWDGLLLPEPRTIILWCLHTHYNRRLRHKQNVSSSHIMQFCLNSGIQERTKKKCKCRLYIEHSVRPWRYRGRQGKPTWEP